MTKKSLRLLKINKSKNEVSVDQNEDPRSYSDHNELIVKYLQSHRIRNHSAKTIKKEEAFLKSWFLEHGNGISPLYTWEAMQPVSGRKRILDYTNTLLESGLASSTVRSYLGILSRYFSYVLEFPYIGENEHIERISHRYNSIEQPVSGYDRPKHVYDGEQQGTPLDPERLYEFYSIIRENYITGGRNKTVRARNYAMVVLAGESGLRVDELLHLEVSDLFFESNKLQTRYAKGTKGSGKRSRVTLFTPLARDSIRYYLENHRPVLNNKNNLKLLFMSKTGNRLDYTTAHLALKEMVSVVNKNGFPVLNHMSFHWLRRLFATRFIERFPNQLSALVSLLGHVTPNTVHCYIRHSEAWMDKKILELLEKGGNTWPSAGS